MRYMALLRSSPSTMASRPPQALMDAMDRFIRDGFAAGTVVDTGGLLADGGARVRLSRGKVTVTDGPYTEAKEIVGGYAVLEFTSREQAVASVVQIMELHREHWPEWEGESELRVLAQVPAPA
jgi:hypothetical protein